MYRQTISTRHVYLFIAPKMVFVEVGLKGENVRTKKEEKKNINKSKTQFTVKMNMHVSISGTRKDVYGCGVMWCAGRYYKYLEADDCVQHECEECELNDI